MSQQSFAGKSKASLLEIVRLTAVMPLEEAEALSREELEARLHALNQTQVAEAAQASDKNASSKRKHLRKEQEEVVQAMPVQTKRRGRPKKKPVPTSLEASVATVSQANPSESSQALPKNTVEVPREHAVDEVEWTLDKLQVEAERCLEGKQPFSKALQEALAPLLNRRGRKAKWILEAKRAIEHQLLREEEAKRTQLVAELTQDLDRSEEDGSGVTESDWEDRPQKGRTRPKRQRNHGKLESEMSSELTVASEETKTGALNLAPPATDEETKEKGVPKEQEAQSDANATDKPASESKRNKKNKKTKKNQAEASSETAGEAESEEKKEATPVFSGEEVSGVLELNPDGYGFLRKDNYCQGPKDTYVPPQIIRRFNLREGDFLVGQSRAQRDSDRYQAMYYLKTCNGQTLDKLYRRPNFDRLTPIYPNERFNLETNRQELATRMIDLICPIGKGQRGMIVSPPKAGKTILLQKIANAISQNNPESKLIVLLIDERPEEVTDMQRSIQGEVVYSTFDKTPENHVRIAELVLARAMRLVEQGEDVVILLDSITRLARAYNLTINPTGRTLSGGLDPGALYGPKRFFGAARNIENGGSLTIVATALVETGSRMDEVIFEEFKGTGNMEVYLDRKLSEKRIFPAIDLNRSGTRREELLLQKEALEAVWSIRKAFGQMEVGRVTETIINLMLKTQDNHHFIGSINVSLNNKALFETMRIGNGAGASQAGSPNGK